MKSPLSFCHFFFELSLSSLFFDLDNYTIMNCYLRHAVLRAAVTLDRADQSYTLKRSEMYEGKEKKLWFISLRFNICTEKQLVTLIATTLLSARQFFYDCIKSR